MEPLRVLNKGLKKRSAADVNILWVSIIIHVFMFVVKEIC